MFGLRIKNCLVLPKEWDLSESASLFPKNVILSRLT